MPKLFKRKGSGGWIFLSLVLLAYGLLSLANRDDAIQAMAVFLRVMRQVIPVLGLVFVLLFLANYFLKAQWIKRYLGKQAGIKGWLVAAGGGVISIGPIYAWYAVLSELKSKGMRTGLIATFLYSRAVKLPLLPLMIHYFGIAYTIVLCGYLIIFSVISGALVERLLPPEPNS